MTRDYNQNVNIWKSTSAVVEGYFALLRTVFDRTAPAYGSGNSNTPGSLLQARFDQGTIFFFIINIYKGIEQFT